MTEADLIARYDGRAPRYTSYPTAPHFTPSVGPQVYAGWLGELDPQTPLSLYLHVPFCDRLCFYCGCNTSVVRLDSSRRAYAALLEREIALVAAFIGRRARVSHVHWGGGTPTSLPGDRLTAIMDADPQAVRSRCRRRSRDRARPDDACPRTVSTRSRPMGVTRISLGVQDLEPAVQDAIGRRQSYEQTEACAAGGAFARGPFAQPRPDLRPAAADRGERRAHRAAGARTGADRVAVFGYAHVPWMKKHQSLIPEESLPGAAERFAQQQTIHRVLIEEGGYIPVGLDHYARAGDAMAEAAAARRLRRGFQGYTTDGAPALIGFGASAIGALPQGYVQNATAAAAYGKLIESGGLATVRGVALRADDRLRRDVIERLMCDLEVDLIEMAEAHAADPGAADRGSRRPQPIRNRTGSPIGMAGESR